MLDGSYLRAFLKCEKLFIDLFKELEKFDISERLKIGRRRGRWSNECQNLSYINAWGHIEKFLEDLFQTFQDD